MKKITVLASLLLFLMAACGPTQNQAVKYNDTIMAIIDGLAVEHTLFLDQVDGHNLDSLQITHKLFTAKAKASLDSSNKIGPFADKKEFIDIIHEYFTTINTIANNEGKQMVEIMVKDSSNMSQQDLDKINELAARFDAGYSKVYDKVLAAQTNFAKEWKFELAEPKK